MLSRRWIVNLVLIALVVILAFAGNYFDAGNETQPLRHITGLEQSQIESIEIQTADSTLALKRDGSGWNIESPVRWPANGVNVERLINIRVSETDSRLPADELDLAQLGLKIPKATIYLNGIPVYFGITNNIGERRYVMHGTTVFLLPDVHLPFVLQGLAGMIDRRLIPPGFELLKLKLPGFEISREGANAWSMMPAEDFSQQQIDGLIENWGTLEPTRVKRYVANTPALQRVMLQLKNDRRYELLIVATEPELVIANPQIGLQYHFPGVAYYQLIALRADENPA